MTDGEVIVEKHEVLERANNFKTSVDLLDKNNAPSIPIEMNACFACELYLKYLICFTKQSSITVYEMRNKFKDENSNKSVHGLKALYDRLENDIKNDIMAKMGIGFIENLEKESEKFISVRYEYEYETMRFMPTFAKQFMNVLNEICNE